MCNAKQHSSVAATIPEWGEQQYEGVRRRMHIQSAAVGGATTLQAQAHVGMLSRVHRVATATVGCDESQAEFLHNNQLPSSSPGRRARRSVYNCQRSTLDVLWSSTSVIGATVDDDCIEHCHIFFGLKFIQRARETYTTTRIRSLVAGQNHRIE